MAKKSSVIKNNKRLKLAEISKAKRKTVITIAKNENLPFEERLKAQKKLSEMSPDSSKTRHRNRCALTGRPRGFLRKFGLSRIAMRELASWGQISGLVKSSW